MNSDFSILHVWFFCAFSESYLDACIHAYKQNEKKMWEWDLGIRSKIALAMRSDSSVSEIDFQSHESKFVGTYLERHELERSTFLRFKPLSPKKASVCDYCLYNHTDGFSKTLRKSFWHSYFLSFITMKSITWLLHLKFLQSIATIFNVKKYNLSVFNWTK